MTDKTATERLREMLDGLREVGNLHEFAELFGFNWYDDSDWTWHDVAVKMADEFEQAIVATLGKKGYYTDRDDEGTHIMCDRCGEYIGTAEEIAATLGGWECENVGEITDFCCSECGARLYTEMADGYTMIEDDEKTIIKAPKYCPNCGRKVVSK